MSGPRAFEIADACFRAASESPEPAPPGVCRFGRFVDPDGRPVDHGYLVTFAGERSYTAEPVAELWTHGSPAVLEALVRSLLRSGARAADAGEFTFRAVAHGRIDLAEAEAIRDLIAADTRFQARVAFAQVEGALSRRIAPLVARLEDLIVRGEAAVEFVDESETHLPRARLLDDLTTVGEACRELLADFERGRRVREGATVVLAGLPNAGKSSVFNRLVTRERAIVTEVPGTTRDTLEETVDLSGVPVTLVDTAGVRESADPVETEGVRRTRGAIAEADAVIWVVDASGSAPEEGRTAAGLASVDVPAVVAWNKCDLAGNGGEDSRTIPEPRTAPIPAAGREDPPQVTISAKTGEGFGALREAVAAIVGSPEVSDAATDPILTNARHAEAIHGALEALERGREASRSGVPEEIVLEEAHAARRSLGEVTGAWSAEAMYDRIFSTFCIGK